jgi:uncharacterized Zn finger protein
VRIGIFRWLSRRGIVSWKRQAPQAPVTRVHSAEVQPTLVEVVTRENLRHLAGQRSFDRGEEYARFGAVGSLQLDEASIRAGVQGSTAYRVRLEIAAGELVGSCSCPVGRDGLFCKHCVAVGLAWLSQSQECGQRLHGPTRSELHSRLVALGSDALADLLVEHALEDERLHARILALTAGAGRKSGLDFQQLAHAFDVACDPSGFTPWNEAYGFARGPEEVIDAVEPQLGSGYGAEMVAFCEHALRRVEDALECVDDSNGELGMVKDRLEELHLDACREACPDPPELAERLFRWELESEQETFLGAVERYADVLGEEGIARYRELAEAAWADEPELGPASGLVWSSRRWRLSQVMEQLARAEGDVDAVVAVLARDRSSPYRYLLIAEALLDAGRSSEATGWAERGLVAFPDDPDSRLVDFVCDRYSESDRHEEATQLAWGILECSPRLEAYERLARVGARAGTWDSWRRRAHDVLRRGPATVFGARDGSELVAVLLWEGDFDEAWREAQTCGCRRELWLALARHRETDHPADALEVYRTQIEPAIRDSDNHTYTGAFDWLEKVRALSMRLEQEEAFDELVRDVRERHRAKRNLIKRLDERGWGQLSEKRALHS